MADETIQDDHPEIVPKSVPKPEREPIVIEGEATDVTPPAPEPAPMEGVAEAEVHTAAEAEPVEPVSGAATEPESPERVIPAAAEAEPIEPVAEAAPEPEATPPAEPPTSAPEAASGAPRAARESRAASIGRMIGLSVLVVIAVLVGVFVPPLFTDDKKLTDERIGAVETALKEEISARKALETRIASAEAKPNPTPATPTPAAPSLDALETRVAKLETAVASALSTAAESKSAAANPLPTPSATPVAAAPSPTPAAPVDDALADRVGKLEAALAAPKPAPTQDPDIAKLASAGGALADRIAKLEAALTAQKSEARAEPLAVEKRLDPVAEAVAAISLAQRLAEGEPYAAEFAALSRSGADSRALGALKPYADTGAPTPGKLAVAFAKLAPTLVAPAKTEAKGEIVDKMMDQLRGLVKVHAVSEIPGDDPTALTSQISAELARGDVVAALATESKLPEAARAAAAPWVRDAQGLENAQSAARSLAETALERFADAKN